MDRGRLSRQQTRLCVQVQQLRFHPTHSLHYGGASWQCRIFSNALHPGAFARRCPLCRPLSMSPSILVPAAGWTGLGPRTTSPVKAETQVGGCMAPRHPQYPPQDPSSCSSFRPGVLTPQWVCTFQWHLPLLLTLIPGVMSLLGHLFCESSQGAQTWSCQPFIPCAHHRVWLSGFS